MTTYRVLADTLHTYADATIKYFSKVHGLPAPKIEAEVDESIDFRPTLQFATPDKHIVCVEMVADILFPLEIRTFILSCRNHTIPAKLYVAIPKGQLPSIPTIDLKFAQENGIGILEITDNSVGQEITKPVALSLSGLRAFKVSDYPAKYRPQLNTAIDTFKQGDPAKGCSTVYDEIEQLVRRLGKKCSNKTGAFKQAGNLNWDTGNLKPMLEFIRAQLDRNASGCTRLTDAQLVRLIGITDHRNETGHKPSSLAKLIARDKQLRTRFETAMDELAALIAATSSLRI